MRKAASISTALIAGFLTASFCDAQQDVNARDMFYSAADLIGKRPGAQHKDPVPPHHMGSKDGSTAKGSTTVSVALSPLGVRYSILKRNAAKKFAEVPGDAVFHAGDRLRLSVMSNQRGYLYIIQRGSSGNWKPLFPDAEINGGKNLVEAGKQLDIPSGAGEAFEIDEQAGEEKIFLLLTRQPEKDLDATILALQRSLSEQSGVVTATVVHPKGNIDDGLIAQLRNEVQSRDLVFTRTDDAADQEKAVYVVNKSAAKPDARVVVDVTLNHK